MHAQPLKSAKEAHASTRIKLSNAKKLALAITSFRVATRTLRVDACRTIYLESCTVSILEVFVLLVSITLTAPLGLVGCKLIVLVLF